MQIITLVKRNMMLFFKDKSAVFFSLMAVFVVLGLYVAFLGDMMIKPLEEMLGDKARELSDVWIMAGTLGIVSLTTSLSVLGIIIEDKSKSIFNDFQITPIHNSQIALGYILSTFLITFIISLFTLGLAEIYIVAYGGQLMSIFTFFKVLLIMCLAIFCSTSVLYVFMSFFKSATSFSNVTTIIGTLSGFLMGIYVPMGALPGFLQTIIKFFPPSHGASLFRKIMMEDVINRVFVNVPAQAIADFRQQFGLDFTYGNHIFTTFENVIVLIGVGFIFFIIAVILMRKKKRI